MNLTSQNKEEKISEKSHSPSQITFKTINVEGLNAIIKHWEGNIYKKEVLIKMKEERKIDENLKKGIEMICWLADNKNNVIVLTETKLTDPKKSITFKNTINKYTNKAFWIFCNNSKDENANKGVITMIPKKLFTKPKHKIIKHGMVTESILTPLENKKMKITLISYYNNDFQNNRNLSEEIIEKYLHLNKWIMAGDFNQKMDYERDVKRNYKISEKSENKSLCVKFENIVKNSNLFYEIEDNKYTHKSIKNFDNEIKEKETRLDWILFSKYFNDLEKKVIKLPTLTLKLIIL